MNAPYIDEFTAAFDVSVDALGITNGTSAARHAVHEMYQRAFAYIRDSGAANPAFSSHAPDHTIRMAHRFNDVIQSLEVGEESPLRLIETLVLAYAAFSWHDVAMGVVPDEAHSHSMEEIWQGAHTRTEHARRSLEVIEQLSPDDTPQWNAFWGQVGSSRPGWPTPPGKYARLLLCRICSSHGDRDDVWLKKEQLVTYAIGGQSDAVGSLQFPDVWSDAWPSFEPVFFTAVGMLNLVDTLDIAPERYILPATPFMQQTSLPLNAAIRETFLHWLGNQVLRLGFDFVSGKVVLRYALRRTNDGRNLYLPSTNAGPGGTLMRYGNDKKLIGILNEYVKLRFSGVECQPGSIDEAIWAKVDEELGDGAFSQDSLTTPLNQSLSVLAGLNRSPTDLLLDALWWRSCYQKPELTHADDVSNTTSIGLSTEVWLLTKLLHLGYLVDLAVAPLVSPPVANVYVVNPELASETGMSRRIGDVFLCAISLCRSLTDLPDGPTRIYLTGRGQHRHRRLLSPEDDLDGELIDSIFVVIVRSGADTNEYLRLARESHHSSTRIVLVCESVEDAVTLANGGCRPVEYGLRPGAGTILGSNISLMKVEDGELTIQSPFETGTLRDDIEPPRAITSPTAVLFEQYLSASGYHALVDRVVDSLDQPSSKIRDLAAGAVLLVALLELFDNAFLRGIRTTAGDEYERIRAAANSHRYPPIKEVVAWLRGSALAASEGLDRAARQDGRREFLQRVVEYEPYAYLFQREALYRAAVAGRSFNVSVLGTSWGELPARLWFEVVSSLLNGPSVRPLQQHANTWTFASIVSHCMHITASVQKREDTERRDFASWLSTNFPTLRGNAGLVSFQMLYHLVRIDQSLLVWGDEDDLLRAETGQLALLEALGSSGADLNIREQELVLELATTLADSAHGEPTRAGIMAFDIAYKYSRVRQDFARGVAPLFAGSAADNLSSIARYFHEKEAAPPELDIRRSRLWSDWHALRSRFVSLQDYVPSEIRRQPVESELAERVAHSDVDISSIDNNEEGR